MSGNGKQCQNLLGMSRGLIRTGSHMASDMLGASKGRATDGALVVSGHGGERAVVGVLVVGVGAGRGCLVGLGTKGMGANGDDRVPWVAAQTLCSAVLSSKVWSERGGGDGMGCGIGNGWG